MTGNGSVPPANPPARPTCKPCRSGGLDPREVASMTTDQIRDAAINVSESVRMAWAREGHRSDRDTMRRKDARERVQWITPLYCVDSRFAREVEKAAMADLAWLIYR
jgi:hypothetical protein